MQATVSIKTVYEPSPGKTNWAIIGGDGMRYSVPPKFSQLLHQGQSVALDYQVKQFNGKEARMVDMVHTMGNGQQHPQGDPSPAPPPHGSNHGPKPHTQEKGMFIMGVVGRAMGSGQFSATDVKLLALAAADAWDAVS